MVDDDDDDEVRLVFGGRVLARRYAFLLACAETNERAKRLPASVFQLCSLGLGLHGGCLNRQDGFNLTTSTSLWL